MRQSRTSRTTWATLVLAVALVGWFLTSQRGSHQQQPEHNPDRQLVTPMPVTQEITIRAGTAVKAPIGDFSIRLDRATKQSVSLIVSSETKDIYRFKNATAGQRLMIPSHDGTYYLDIKQIGGGAVSLTMGKQR